MLEKISTETACQTWMIIVCDKDYRIVNIINPQPSLLLLAPDAHVGMDVRQIEKKCDSANVNCAKMIAANVKRALDGNSNVYFEYQLVHKDKSTINAICYADKAQDGLVYLNILQVDENIVFEAREELSHNVIKATMNGISVGAYLRHFDGDGNKSYIFFNNVAKSFFKNEKVTESEYWSQEEDDEADDNLLHDGESHRREKRLRNADGEETRWLVEIKKKVKSRGTGYYIITTLVDVTKRRQSEALLEQQYNLINLMYENLPIGIMLFEANGNLVSMNQMFVDVFGIEKNRDIRMKSGEILNFFTNTVIPSDVKQRVKACENVEFELAFNFKSLNKTTAETKKTGIMILHSKTVVIKDSRGEVNGYFLICEDITAKKRTEHRLWTKRQLINSIYNTIPECVARYDKKGVLLEMNDYGMKMLGIKDKEKVIGLNIFDDPKTPVDIKEKMRHGEDVAYTIAFESSVIDELNSSMKSFKEHNVSVNLRVLKDTDNNIDGFLLIAKDETEKLRRKRLMEEAVTKFTAMFDSISNGIEIFDKDGILIDCNDADLRMFGIDDKETLINSRISIYDDPNVPTEALRSLSKNDILKRTIVYDFDKIKNERYYGTTRTGKIILEMKFAPMFINKNEFIGYVSELNDVTDSEQGKIELFKTQQELKLAMAAGNITAWSYDVATKKFKVIHGDNSIKDVYWDDLKVRTHPDDVKNISAIFNKLVSKEIKESQYVYRAVDDKVNGGYVSYDCSVMAVYTDGRVSSITGTMRNITVEIEHKRQLEVMRHEAQRAKELLDEIVDRVPGSIFIKDAKTSQFITANHAFCKMVNKDIDSIIGHTVYDMFPHEIAEEYENYQKDLTVEGHSVVSFLTEMPHDGEVAYYQVSKSMIESQGMKIILGVASDVTHLHTVNKELEKAKVKAEESDNLKSAFLANMSHEIRTPLNAIVGFSELIQDAEDKEEKEEYMKIINVNNRLLLTLISDILDLSKIESGLMELKPQNFDVNEVFNELYTSMKKRYADSVVSLIVNCPCDKCVVRLDRNRLVQIMTNFVTNAFKYTYSGSIVMGYECIDDGLRVYVTDTGVGIPKEKQHLLFHRFCKLNDFVQGTGLGLSICKAIVDAKNGKIGCDSEPGKGSTFWAWIPCKFPLEK